MRTQADVESISKLLRNLRGLEPLKQLFWQELNYDRVAHTIPTSSWTDSERAALADEPVLFAQAGKGGDFHVVYCPLHSMDRLHITDERILINRLIRDHLYSLFVFSDANQEKWHFVNVRNDPLVTKRRIFRRISVGPDERLRTASERISLLDVASMSPEPSDLSALDIQQKHDEAFNVEAVTKQFFDDYCVVFESLQRELLRHIRDKRWAHDYALGFMNRLMFMYFIQRKRWLGNDTEFMRSYWNAYSSAGRPKDTFFEEWLKPLFFHAFNNDKGLFNTPRMQYIPEDLRRVLATAPYLNGGLFSENSLDRPGKPFNVADECFEQILEFLDRYNFTIAEDSPLDQEVAVDPEMIGKVYESLVNVSEETTERGDAGIFYTPRTEIDLMCRLALVDNLSNRIGSDHRNILYELVFALEPEEKISVDEAVKSAGLWRQIRDTLRDTKIVDPACGSGSFLVGMLHILDDLEMRAQKYLGESEKPESAYERRKRIVGQCLYGVDVMEWACHIAELRLWLALVIDAEFSGAELAARNEPLLPNFTFNIRCGDSLVEEVAGIDLAHLAESGLSAQMKRCITSLSAEKAKFYYCDGDCKFRTVQDAQQAERALFNEILQDRINSARRELAAIGPQPQQASFGISGLDKPAQASLAESEDWKKQREAKQAEIDTLERARQALAEMSGMPFVWKIAFAEVFHGDKGGFDIVVGNPPYVRQENISDPRLPREMVNVDNKREYKARLALTTYRDHPSFFQYKPGKNEAGRKIDAKSDLYIYFYFRGLHILNPTGSFVFITSNSWLDVGYGADLQEFLLRQCHVKLVIDNQVKRSFASADVNSIICLLSAPLRASDAGLDHDARFVMFKTPFEQVLSAVVFQEIEEAKGRRTTPEYRVQCVPQRELLERGFDQPAEDEDEPGSAGSDKRFPLVKVAKYVGDKWGGKYLRAPDIYWTILEKGKDKLVRLGDIAEVRRGFTTGCNEFFYLDEEKIRQWGIEEEFLRPVITSPRECVRIGVSALEASYHVFLCPKDKRELAGTAAADYIAWGESQRFDLRPSCSSRERWWDLGERVPGLWGWPYILRERIFAVFNRNHELYFDCNLFDVQPANEPLGLGMFLNSSVHNLQLEIIARTYGGGGGPIKTQVYELESMLAPKGLQDTLDPGMEDLLYDMQVLPISDMLGLEPRQRIDAAVFDLLDLTDGERDAVYEAVLDLVAKRLSKAESL